jgi:hypothetical protein
LYEQVRRVADITETLEEKQMETLAIMIMAAVIATMAETAIGHACGDKEFEESVRIEEALWAEKLASREEGAE